MNAIQELEWLKLAQRGDRAAFARLVQAYQGPVYNLCYRMLGNSVEAEDATQETFLRVYLKLNTYSQEHKLSSWMLSIASHYCIDRLRRRRGETVSLDEEPVAAALPAHQAGPEETALTAEARDAVRGAVEKLDPAYRVPLILRYWHDLSYQEIADVMGLTVQAVKSRLHRARLQMIEAASTSEAPLGLVAPLGLRHGA
ncbi:MAG: sigma-70 family RNA polymerase sigma factor [Anaerolineae bacterium]|nr:sigma-70 family RNA polymerase sigma factor [Anaerolineae bacterium]